jgi:putative hemin transport protein
METMTDTVHEAWAAMKAEGAPRAREAAERLGISEGEFVARGYAGECVPLRAEWEVLLARLPTLGRVMALTRNETAVSELTGEYAALQCFGAMAQVVGDPIDLRIFLRRWAFGFAVRGLQRGEVVRSLQFFDAHGGALHKVYLRSDEGVAAYDALVAAFADASTRARPTPRAPAEPDRPDAQVDAEALHSAWSALQDTHEFFGLLRRHAVSRLQSMRLMEGRWTERVPRDCLSALLERAAAQGVPIMVFVGNEGVVQIFHGLVRRVKVIDGWVNVLDPTFNLHVLASGVSSAWRVRKPTRNGVVTSLELYDARGENLLLAFGVRDEDKHEPQAWRDLVGGL